jgi:hypothetical protein
MPRIDPLVVIKIEPGSAELAQRGWRPARNPLPQPVQLGMLDLPSGRQSWIAAAKRWASSSRASGALSSTAPPSELTSGRSKLAITGLEFEWNRNVACAIHSVPSSLLVYVPRSVQTPPLGQQVAQKSRATVAIAHPAMKCRLDGLLPLLKLCGGP